MKVEKQENREKGGKSNAGLTAIGKTDVESDLRQYRGKSTKGRKPLCSTEERTVIGKEKG